MPEPQPSLKQMLAALKRQAGSPNKALPPVDQWNPAQCGEIGMEILADGTWRHEGTPITRESLVRLFASILRKDADGETYLVTPAEKVRVAVADASFLAIRADRAGEGADQTIVFTTNVGDVVPLDAAHPLRITYTDAAPRPYVLVRGRLEARILRAPWRELAEWSEERDGSWGLSIRRFASICAIEQDAIEHGHQASADDRLEIAGRCRTGVTPVHRRRCSCWR